MVATGSLPITFETETLQEQTASTSSETFSTIVRNAATLKKLFICFSNATQRGYVGSSGELLKELLQLSVSSTCTRNQREGILSPRTRFVGYFGNRKSSYAVAGGAGH